MEKGIYIKKAHIQAPVEEVFRWHERPGAINRLSPPWDPLVVIRSTGGIEKGARVALKMKAGPVAYNWSALHTDYQENRLFKDEQVKGPFSKWVHTHMFEPDGDGGCILEDRIAYKLPFDFLMGRPADPFIKKKLERIFAYRHKITQEDIAIHLSGKKKKPLTILISGASGLVGSALIPFLTTGGHRVIRLVRRYPLTGKDDVFWDPAKGVLNVDDINHIDAVVHLSGENIGEGLWTQAKKKKIVDSRVNGTRLISETLSKLKTPPDVLVCASAIGYYGNRGEQHLTEADGPGDDFISDVCSQWEKAAAPAIENGIRTVFMRIGVVLTPLGGALSKLLLPFKSGLGGKFGPGNQYMSWVHMDDVIGAIYHAFYDNRMNGPVNLVSPEHVTNLDFTRTLGRVLRRPTMASIPSHVIKLAFGQMGREVLLSSTRVTPKKLMDAGYAFRHPGLEASLKQMLGIM